MTAYGYVELIFSLEDKIRFIPGAQLNSLSKIYPLGSTIHLLNNLDFLRRRIFSWNLCWRHYLDFSSWAYDLTQRSQWRIQWRRPPLFFDQNDDRRAEKIFLWRPPPTPPPPPLSQGLDDRPPPPYLMVWIRHWKPWPKTKFKGWQTWLTWAICAICSSLQALLKKMSATENWEIAKWQKS